MDMVGDHFCWGTVDAKALRRKHPMTIVGITRRLAQSSGAIWWKNDRR